MITKEESYQLFVDYARTRIPGKALSYTLDDPNRTLSFVWINEKNDQVKTKLSFREDLYTLLKHHRDFSYAFSLSSYVWINGDYHLGFTRFSVLFRLPNRDTYKIQLLSRATAWKVWFLTERLVDHSDKGCSFVVVSEFEKTEKTRSLQAAAEKALFEIPEFRLLALTNQLEVMRR